MPGIQSNKLVFTVFSLLAGATLQAEELVQDDKAEHKPVAPAQAFITSHRASFNGQPIEYSVTAGEVR